jgi:hypothetical protein
MADCPLADDCPSFDERIQGMGCQHYGNKGGAEWCNHYDMPIYELKQSRSTISTRAVPASAAPKTGSSCSSTACFRRLARPWRSTG